MAAIRAGGRRSYKVNGDLTGGEFHKPVGAASWPRSRRRTALLLRPGARERAAGLAACLSTRPAALSACRPPP
jgi:hypothetical protein